MFLVHTGSGLFFIRLLFKFMKSWDKACLIINNSQWDLECSCLVDLVFETPFPNLLSYFLFRLVYFLISELYFWTFLEAIFGTICLVVYLAFFFHFFLKIWLWQLYKPILSLRQELEIAQSSIRRVLGSGWISGRHLATNSQEKFIDSWIE